jgi:hypothetical protein
MTSWNDKRREGQRIKPEWQDSYEEFFGLGKKRMRAGHREYGDRSFDRPLFALMAEIEEELLDCPNWAFIAWSRLNRLKKKIEILEDSLDTAEMATLIEEIEEVG